MSIRIPLIGIGNQTIPRVTVNGTGIPLVQPINSGVRSIGTIQIADNRVWMQTPPQAVPVTVPVTVFAGTPVVYMPGCVTVHKENAKRDPSSNKNLVNDDPKGQTTLCDAGMPSYYPADYDYRELSWQTVYQDQEDVDEGVEAGEQDPIDAPAPPPPPPSGGETAEEVECPPLNARRIGDLNQSGTEKIKEYKLTVDGKRCETIWEPVPQIEQYLPSMGTVTTTATIATVATASALFAKPLADLILKVVKPVVKKTIAKVQKMLGKNPRRPTLQEKMTDQYREKKGLLPMKKK
mgnify:CR=1 FL=1|tara:strand:- start:185 stop:1063 length:879 start_codon:yes stop_codon:yes gene_type:complete